MSRFARDFQAQYERWRRDIRVFAKEGMNFTYTWQQEQLFDAVQVDSYLPVHRRKKRIAVKSGQGPGKTASSGIVALWRVLRYPDSLCVVTSPSMRQCRQWVDEVKRLLKDAHPALQRFVRCFNTRIEINGSNIWGIRTATATRPENLQGIHEEHLTFIVDEASGVAPSIIETIQGTLSNPDSLLIQIGNPNTSDCKFYDCFGINRDLWYTITWNAEDTARDYPHIVSPSRNKQLEIEYGRQSDVYRVRVLGEFPLSDPNAVMAMEDLIACTQTSKLGCSKIVDKPIKVNNAIAIDYARYGSDESVVARRRGLAVVDWKVFVKRDPREVTDYAFLKQHEAGWKNPDCWYLPDAGGMGQGVMHAFYEAGKQVLEFHTQGRAADASMYADRYTEAWWNLRQLTRARIIHLPNDQRLLKQLGTRQYYMARDGRIKVESKDEWRDRLEETESPDRADAIAMVFYPHLAASAKIARLERLNRIVGSKVRRER